MHLKVQADQEQPLCLTIKMKVWKDYYISLDFEGKVKITIEGAR